MNKNFKMKEPYSTFKPVEVPLPYYVDHGKMILKTGTKPLWNFAKPFIKTLMDPNRTRPILTVANHLSTLDDPLLWGSIPFKNFLSRHRTRWTLGAQEICFTTPKLSNFFALGQVIPTIRGAGIYQPAMNFALERLNEGRWIHIFPEAKINQTTELIYFKWGIGRLIMESINPPIVIPIWHKGFEKVMPKERDHTWIPLFGKNIVIVYGDPIDFKDILINYRAGKTDEATNY
ncbi:acyltransferase-domain-containing protein [Gigaspora margarita]|uniref:Tafazzin family protein n=1 Tax=Gigaspora margarita TaxID=4874 RepID=A0A8H4ANX0_GIGMA|nr:acyltransferase-domain-containing protein [Gigaspora margarita]